jgi:two-component system, OmpR family, phosphate regulon sensor histidine kinase PhoR
MYQACEALHLYCYLIGMKKLSVLTVLMAISLLVITGFQLYWLNNNYERERRNLDLKTNMAFAETLHRLQTAKLKLKFPFPGDSLKKKSMQIIVNDVGMEQRFKITADSREEIISTANVLRDKLMDSAKHLQKQSEALFLTVNRDSLFSDSEANLTTGPEAVGSSNHIFRYLYGIDSLQDSIHIPELTRAFQQKQVTENIVVPFSIQKRDARLRDDSLAKPEIIIGFAHPIAYQVILGNTFPYLMKKMTQPILFSIFLVGLTLLSFVLLYRNLRAQQRLTTIKNDFISNITHELKTPIATVSVAIEAMKNFNVLDNPQRAKEYLDISGNELQRLSLLVDKVLKLSMFENKQIALQRESFNLIELTEEIMLAMKPQFEKQKALVTLENQGTNFVILADKLHMSSVIYNLLDNALKYSKENPAIAITITDHQQFIAWRIADNGIGIEPVYKNKIFERFFRVPNGNRHNVKGYGLGLSYVNHIVASHQGFIELESTPGKGSVFTVMLPFEEADIIHYDKGRTVRKVHFKIG